MKKVIPLLTCILVPLFAVSQNVGVGTLAPIMPFHVFTSGSSISLFENAQLLDVDIASAIYFKTGAGSFPYTGAIKTIGQNTSEARLGLFTYASSTFGGLQERLSILDNGNVGVGILDPSAKLHVDDALQVTGSWTNGAPLTLAGSGTRMFFNGRKSAFRAGSVGGNQWDDSNVGDLSFAVGEDTKASGIRTTAFGTGTTASNAGATAFGSNTNATGLISTSMGSTTTASGFASTAMGEGTTAGGQHTTATGFQSNAIGFKSTSMGHGTLSNGYASLAIGQYNDAIVTFESTMQPTTPLFIIGNGTTTNARTNVMVARNDGHVGIGTNTPNSIFEVNGASATKVNIITGATTLTKFHSTVLCNSASNFTVTLPTAVGISGRLYTIKNISTGIVTVDGNGSEKIDNALTVLLSIKFSYINIISDGSNWYILSGSNSFYIGQSYQGGKIGYIDATGQHGLIAAPTDILVSPQYFGWGCQGTDLSGAEGSAIGTGFQNTIDIVAGCGGLDISARLCSDLILGGYDDWYLPSLDELLAIYTNRDLIGGFDDTSQPFNSSTESGANNNKAVNFNGGGIVIDQKMFLRRVRAVRSF